MKTCFLPEGDVLIVACWISDLDPTGESGDEWGGEFYVSLETLGRSKPCVDCLCLNLALS